MMNSTVLLTPAETAGQRDGTAHVEIQHMMAVLRRLELTYRARDAEDIQVARRGQHESQYSAKPCSQQGLAACRGLQPAGPPSVASMADAKNHPNVRAGRRSARQSGAHEQKTLPVRL